MNAPAPQKFDAPLWLRQRLVEARATRGKAYQLAVLQGLLELPDWAYFLYSRDNKRLLDNTAELQRLFDAVVDRAVGGSDPQIRIVGAQRNEHFIMLSGAGLNSEMQQLGLLGSYAWHPDPEA